MKRLPIYFASTLLLAATYSNAASAQASDQCYQMAEIVCGGEELVPCMGRPEMMEQMPPACVGDMQTMIEMEREFYAEQDEAFERNANNATQDDTVSGMSYGGVLRSGPGMEYDRVASLREGDYLDILEDTGVWFNDYKWYLVASPQGTGYHWGGIICVNLDTQIEGIFEKC